MMPDETLPGDPDDSRPRDFPPDTETHGIPDDIDIPDTDDFGLPDDIRDMIPPDVVRQITGIDDS